LAEAVEDLEQARMFYEERETGIGDYCVTSLLADISSLALAHGIPGRHHGCFRMLASRFPFGIYYVETEHATRVIAVLDLRRNPNWIRKLVTKRRSS
jgi:hypothetical protein